VDVWVEAIGSDAGLDRLIQYNDADLALLSRPLNDQDKIKATLAGKALAALPLAWDAVSIVVPTSNRWAQNLTADQAARAFTTATLWSDLDPAWPALPVHRFVLGPRSGTSDIFAANLLAGDKARLYASAAVQSSEDDRILARGLAQVDGSVGFLGWTTVQEANLPLRVLALDGVTPTAETIRDHSYGLPRLLWLVGDSKTWKQQPALKSLVHYLYDHYSSLVAGTPLVPLTDDERRSVDSILNATL
jgi:phosphate transport system substrate-binding protein